HDYYFRDEIEPFRKYLYLSIKHLLRSDDLERLVRAYNLFAVYAQSAGCFDIAYNYYRMANSLVRDDRNSLIRSVLEANTGELLAETGDFKGACTHLKRCIPVLNRNKKNEMYAQTMMNVCINLGLYSIYAGNLTVAHKELERANKIYSKAGEQISEKTGFWYLLFTANLALAENDKARTGGMITKIIEQISGAQFYTEFLSDTQRFCRELMASGDKRSAGRLIAALKKSDLSGASTFRRLKFAQLCIDYYTATGNTAAKKESFAERHALSRANFLEQKKVYLLSVKQMILINEIDAEHDAVRRENEDLQKLAETDALTGLPNRYALNNRLEDVFERSYRRKKMLGIGIIDIDHFKKYNDTYGHQRGDECLRRVAGGLKKIAAEHNLFVARYGGDEFVLIYENRSDAEISDIEAQLLWEIPVTISHGCYNAVPRDKTKFWDHLAMADVHLYRIKQSRR
ncbi:MAG: GGDEF domain-containing protein, partial [Lachnospiraceae bacterium]|nr:GGDEF domain-containing protein [Lachnospiraceae bacterium]